MAKFVIEPHFRLQEWVAEEKGYFRAEGLDYDFQELIRSTAGKHHDRGDKVGAFQSFERGRAADVYSVAPAGVFVPADSAVRTPEDLADVPISVGFQSGSHYATIQALEQYLPADKINLHFADGMLFARMGRLIDGTAPACALFSGPYYFAEQLGFRKVIDTTFMIATMITGDADADDLQKFFRALRRAQRDIDLRPELYTRYYRNEFPDRFHARMDTRRWGPGERLVFERYTEEAWRDAREWIAAHDIFAAGELGARSYADAVMT